MCSDCGHLFCWLTVCSVSWELKIVFVDKLFPSDFTFHMSSISSQNSSIMPYYLTTTEQRNLDTLFLHLTAPWPSPPNKQLHLDDHHRNKEANLSLLSFDLMGRDGISFLLRKSSSLSVIICGRYTIFLGAGVADGETRQLCSAAGHLPNSTCSDGNLPYKVNFVIIFATGLDQTFFRYAANYHHFTLILILGKKESKSRKELRAEIRKRRNGVAGWISGIYSHTLCELP